MKMKTVLISIFAFAVSALIFAQTQQIVAAEKKGNSLATPLSSPITYFLLNGFIQYGSNGNYRPAPNVFVHVVPQHSSSAIGVRTDQNGYYSIGLKPDTYEVTPSDIYGTRFNPISVTLIINSNWTQNFFGYRAITQVK